MFKINDYIVDLYDYGLGIVNDIKNNIINATFIDYGTKTIDINSHQNNIIKLNDSIISFILDDKKYTKDKNLLQKGLTYFETGKVKKLFFSPFILKSVVKGNESYNVTIEFENDKIKWFKCSCPVNGLCKHCIATLYEARQQLLTLKNSIVPLKMLKNRILER